MKQFIIIGNSAAGIAAVEAIRERDKDSKIIVISDEDYSAYCRCMISYYLAGDVQEDKIVYRPKNFYKDNNVELILNKKVSRVDPKKSRVVCEDKTSFSYDNLLIATGASPKFPETPGMKKRGVFGFRTIKDAKEIEGLVPVTKSACVIGGGLIGLKAAYALKKRNIDVKVIIKSKQVLSQMLDFQAAGFVQKKLQEHGIEVILGQDVTEIISDEGELKAVKLDSGKALGCSLVVVGKGVSPNISLIKDSEIKVNEGIIADNFLRTSIPNIYTAGDVCESFDIALGKLTINALWPIAVEQGKVCGINMAGANISYEGSLAMNSIEFFSYPVVSLGVFKIDPKDSSFEELKATDAKASLYKKLILKGNTIIGAILAGDIKNSGVFLRLIRERTDVSSIKDKLLRENFGFPDIIDLVKEKEKLYV
jgi:nitrite reductase (NADH) large subunit